MARRRKERKDERDGILLVLGLDVLPVRSIC